MEASQVRNWMQDVRLNSGVFQTFENVPLTPLHHSDMSGRFSHSPLEHEIVASESIWDEPGTSDELIEEQIVFSPVRSGRSYPAVLASIPQEHSLDTISAQAHFDWELPHDIENAIPTSAVVEPYSKIAGVSRSEFASTETLVETRVALKMTPGPVNVSKMESFFTELWRSPDKRLSITERDIDDEPTSARVLAHSNFPRAAKPTSPASVPEVFDIRMPIFPFPAGTSRCKNRDCPIKVPHEQGPYLHEGKLRTREGSVFGSSNPPPEIWFLYDRAGNGDLPCIDDKPFAPVELFVRYHFGETKGDCVTGPEEARGGVEQEVKLSGKSSRSWRFWSRGKQN